MSAVIETEHLSKRYGKKTAVSDSPSRIPAGRSFGMYGPTGAAKAPSAASIQGERKSIRVRGDYSPQA